MENERKPVSKRTRFEVFKRDKFSCQYCGKSSPDVVLHIDHIKPVSLGGKNTITNLVTACQDCNLGKSNVLLDDSSAISKQKNQIIAMAERDEQISMMVDWQEMLIKSEEKLVCSAIKEINRLMDEKQLSEYGNGKVRKAIKKHGYESVMSQISRAYAASDDKDFCDKCINAINFKFDAEANSKNTMSYVKGILRNRFNGLNDGKFYAEMSSINPSDANIERLIVIAKTCAKLNNFYHYADEVRNG